ncbi:MAG: hypothetical protein D6740_10205, partial [Alphaproteobacteria bacterium]
MAASATAGCWDESWFWALCEGRLAPAARAALIRALAHDPAARRACARVLFQCAVLNRGDGAVLEEPVPARLQRCLARLR